MSPACGWDWTRDFYGKVPKFTVEPDVTTIELLVRTSLCLAPSSCCSATAYDEGLYNKIYKVVTDFDIYIMRVGLPLEAPDKVRSEVATSNFLRHNTSMPIPRIFAYDASANNELRFPWILMEYIQGTNLADRIDDMSMDRKIALTRQIAVYQAELFHLRFQGVGSLYQAVPENTNTQTYIRIVLLGVIMLLLGLGSVLSASACLVVVIWLRMRSNRSQTNTFGLGRIVSNNCIDPVIPSSDFHRPFDNHHNWLRLRISRARESQKRLLLDCDVEARSEIHSMLAFIDRISRLFDMVFPSQPLNSSTILRIHDMNARNVMLDENDNLVGLIDWEFITTSQPSLACHVPRFLEGRECSEEPLRSQYRNTNENDEWVEPSGREGSYGADMWEWEKSNLRKVFLDEMERLEPLWIGEYRAGMMGREYLELILEAEGGWIFSPRMYGWLDMVEKGEWRAGYLDEAENLGDDEEAEEDRDSEADDLVSLMGEEDLDRTLVEERSGKDFALDDVRFTARMLPV